MERKRQEAEEAGRRAARDAERRSRDAAFRAAEEDFLTLLAEVVVETKSETETGNGNEQEEEDFAWDSWKETLASDPLGRGRSREDGGRSTLTERERRRLFERRVGDLKRQKWEREEARKRKEREEEAEEEAEEEEEEEEEEGLEEGEADLSAAAAADAKRARLPAAEEARSDSSDEEE